MRASRKIFLAVSLCLPLQLRANVLVEQLEAQSSSTYAPIEFGGNSTVTISGGSFNGITFHAIDPNALTGTLSAHASGVGGNLYGTGTAGNPYVTDVYCGSANTFIPGVVNPQNMPSTWGPIPGHFSPGVQIVNNSYVDSENSNIDALRRFDFMIKRDDVTFLAAAVIDNGTFNGTYLDWSAYNALAVSADQLGFIPAGSPGKTHADVWTNGLTSFATGTVSGYVAGLYGHAQAATQADAQHDVVMRSLVMAGADKINYTRDTANNLSTVWGAGKANFTNSLSLLQGGEQSIQTLNGATIPGTLTTSLQGWTYGTVAAAGQSVVMFHAANPITGITASLNWDVSPSSSGNTIDTTAEANFAGVKLELRPVTYSAGHYVLGPTLGDPTLQSNATNDNVQYLYSTNTLAAGNYAFVFTGDPTLSPTVGFSYNVTSTATTDRWNLSSGGSWNVSSNWSNGIPNAPAAQANLLASPSGLTAPGSVTLNGNRIVGGLTFNNPQSYSIDPGTGGTLTINDTGDAGGAYPCITVVAGNHTITAPVSLANGVTVNTTVGTALTVNGNISGIGGLVVGGKGTLTLGGIDNYGDTTVNSGALTVNGLISSNNISVAAGAVLNANGSLATSALLTANGAVNFGANSGTTVVARTLGNIAVNAGAKVTLNPAGNGNRTVLVSGMQIAKSAGTWTGKLDLTDNDMIVKNGVLTDIVSQLQTGFNVQSGYWNGTAGIVSSTAASNSKFLTTLGVIQNNDGQGNPIYGNGALYGPFDGQNPGINDVLLKYTYYGDADLNGLIDGRDYSRIDIGFQTHLTGWVNGDFNYDGVIDGSDYTLIDNAFNQHLASLSAVSTSLIASATVQIAPSASTTVPEPAGLALLTSTALAGLLRRRRTIPTSKKSKLV